MEVVIPAMDFDFNSARSSPRSTAPFTPTRVGGGGCFFSAPTSPARLSEFYREFDRFSMMGDRQCSRRSNSLAIPFDWEEKPGTPKSPRGEEEDDFAFAFSEALEKTSLSAEQLFEGGKIKPLKPPPRLQVEEYNQKNPLLSSPRSPKSPLSQGKKFIREAFSPRKKKDRDPFETAIETSRHQTDNHRRGRERVEDLYKNSSRRATRSLSPYRVSTYPWKEEEEKQKQNESTVNKPSSLNSKTSLSSNKGSSRKWRLRDIFLFRSASEGHATDKDLFRKYSSSFLKKPRENKNSRDVGSCRKVSAQEVHYATNKAESENMKKKTFLPYKQGILGRLALNPGF
ncbi:hypothetical protein F3Y22_tig00110163pilonHSYRG00068 [Hibiscus syriacus]|uniref:Uncharacterized protein n=1 Tax=Hibiscus syriacus TaxID=106335 RepID=A0A6A3BHK5_HIBSY|nr:uncharacterized protein LOC120216661 [Hibiscus syriacus]KAE8715507.1 hypothetical protein F3Y22_tig00110163pilonHSYRG00068 [Hibiscus syriacus]